MKTVSTQRWIHYILELFIVIIGISIAFWLNKLAEKDTHKKEKISYLYDIKNDLQKDSLRLAVNIRNNKVKRKKLIKSLELIERSASIDSVLIHILEIGNYDFFNPENFTLTSLLQSGDFKVIDSDQTKRELLRLLKIYSSIDKMQNNFLQALDDNYFPMLISKVDMMEMKAIDPEYFYSVEITNYCGFTLSETARHLKNYQYAQNQVNEVMSLIENELSD
jgi:hypothetical protein